MNQSKKILSASWADPIELTMISKLKRHAVLCRLRRHLKHASSGALILPPARPGSLGDQAMVRATLSTLREAGFSRIGILTYDPTDCYTSDPDIAHYQLRDYLCFGSDEGLFRFIFHAQSHTHFFLIGADVMDGYYSMKETLAKIKLARLGVQCGLKTRVLGFSFNGHAQQSCIEALRALPPTVAMYARDPVSHRRLFDLLGRTIEPSADLAFMLPPNDARPEVRAFLDNMNERKTAGQVLIGLNVASLILGRSPTQAQIWTLLEQVQEMIRVTAAQHPDTAFILFPHD